MQEHFKLKFRQRDADVDLFFCQHKPPPSKRQNGSRCFTTCTLRVFDDYNLFVYSGVAIAHPNEENRWSFSEGKRVAFGRMADNCVAQRIVKHFGNHRALQDAEDVRRTRIAMKGDLYRAFFEAGGKF